MIILHDESVNKKTIRSHVTYFPCDASVVLIIVWNKTKMSNACMQYWDCDGEQNYCGNAVRSFPFVLGIDKIGFFIEVKGELIPAFAWKEGDLCCTMIEVQKFRKLSRKSFKAYVGNYQLVTLSSSDEFELADRITKKWSKLYKGRPPIFSFVKVEGDDVSVRVIEEFGSETMSCCSSASVVTKVLNFLNPEKRDFKLNHPGGTFRTHFHNLIACDIVTIKGEVKGGEK
jgi:hypothetical protein